MYKATFILLVDFVQGCLKGSNCHFLNLSNLLASLAYDAHYWEKRKGTLKKEGKGPQRAEQSILPVNLKKGLP